MRVVKRLAAGAAIAAAVVAIPAGVAGATPAPTDAVKVAGPFATEEICIASRHHIRPNEEAGPCYSDSNGGWHFNYWPFH